MVYSSAVLLLGLPTAVIALNVGATLCIMPSAVYSASSKALQIVLIWLLPLVGAILVLSVWMHDRKPSPHHSVSDDQEPWMPGMGPESDRSRPHGGFGEGATHDGHNGDGGNSGH